jgi:polysaccharide pyruvyl transferase CsaB
LAHLLLAGYFGSGNLGDDAILLGFIQGLGNEGHDVTVMSGVPEETHRNYGFRVVPRKNFDAIKEAMDHCDALVFPGGSIFQDASSVMSVKYYHTLVNMAKAKKKKVLLLAQGVGPVNSFFGKRWTAAAYNMADAVTVRDPFSAQALQSLGVKRPVRVTADMAFLLPRPTEHPDSQEYRVGNMTSVGISVRPHGKGKEVVTLFGELCRLLFQANVKPVLLEMDRNEDGPLILEISKAQGGKIPDARKLQTPMNVQQRLARMDTVIAMRLHAGILAATVGIPPFMVSYDPKVTAFAKMLDIAAAPPIEGLTAQRLFESFMAFNKERERNERIVERRREELSKSAAQNLDILREVVKAPATI